MTTPMTGHEYKTFDDKIRAQAEMLTTLLSAGLQTREAADKAVQALSKLEGEVRSQISLARQDLSGLAEETATQAAKLLTDKFVEANEAAEAAKERYENAARALRLKTFAALFGSLLIISTAAWFLLSPLLPSREEMEFRREEIAAMEAKAAALAKKGVNLEWIDCRTGVLNRTTPCVRTDGNNYVQDNTGHPFAVPYKSR